MKKIGKIIGRLCVGTLAAGLLPYRFQKTGEEGGFEAESLLWSLKKVPGEGRDNYVLTLLPLIGKEKKQAKAEQDKEPAAPAEEDFTEEPAAPAAAPAEETFAEEPAGAPEEPA